MMCTQIQLRFLSQGGCRAARKEERPRGNARGFVIDLGTGQGDGRR